MAESNKKIISAKVIEVEKIRDKEGAHLSYTGKNGILYKYKITFADNAKGTYNSKSANQEKFVVDQYSYYSLTVDESGSYPENIIHAETKPGQPKFKIDPIRQSCRAEMLRCGLFAYGVFQRNATSKEHVNALADKFTQWCLQSDDKTQISIRMRIILNAINCMSESIKMNYDYVDLSEFSWGVDGIDIKTSDDIIELATFMYQYSVLE